MAANYKSGSKTALLLLGQVDATLEAISLTNSNEPVPHKDLKKQCEAVELAAQQQLHLLDLSLQTYKLITAHLTCLNKVLASPDIDLAGLLLDALNVSFEVCLFPLFLHSFTHHSLSLSVYSQRVQH
ncbi:hypothetical protein C0989_011251 [Termitomyces sp. Mn162]|nr:hypothetical protein C0989_011251 [Termitomyces sp. Mn162]